MIKSTVFLAYPALPGGTHHTLLDTMGTNSSKELIYKRLQFVGLARSGKICSVESKKVQIEVPHDYTLLSSDQGLLPLLQESDPADQLLRYVQG